MNKRVGIYARVSKKDQTSENQLRELQEWARNAGHTIVETFTDNGISGAKGRDKRPGFDAMHKAIVNRKIDMIAAWSIDRLGRSMKDLVLFLAECQATGTDLYIRTMGMDTTTPMGRVMFHVAGAFAEAERAMIIERVRAGLARTKATGRNKAGRPVKIGRPRVDPSLAPKVKAMKAAGMGINAIAKALKIGNGAVSRFLKA